MALLHRLDRFLARRIEKADQAEQDQVLRQIPRPEVPRRDGGILLPRQRQHALPLSGKLVRSHEEMVAIDRGGPSVPGLLPIAMIQDDFRGALDEENLPAAGCGVQGGHEFVFRFERDRVDPGVGGLFGGPL